jgi:hypothetical protein
MYVLKSLPKIESFIKEVFFCSVYSTMLIYVHINYQLCNLSSVISGLFVLNLKNDF